MPYSDNACLYQWRRKGGPTECKTQVYGSMAAATSALFDNIKHGGQYFLWEPFCKLYRQFCDEQAVHDRGAKKAKLQEIAKEHFELIEYKLVEIER